MRQRIILLGILFGVLTNLSAQYDSRKWIWIYDLKEALKEPERVYNLDLSNQSLEEVPVELELFKNLRLLKLTDNKISSLDSRLKGLKNLTSINLSGNKIRHLDFSEFEGSKSTIDELWLRNNQLESLDVSINLLPKLIILNIGNNKIAKCDEEIILKNLRYLELDGNKLKSIPQFLKQSTNLKKLSINGNQINEFVLRKHFKKLEKLNLGNNPIEKFEWGTKKLRIEYLCLDWINKDIFELKKIPKSVKVLSLEHCEIERIEDLLHLKKLKELSLIHNEIKTLPTNIHNLRKLDKIWLNGNKIENHGFISTNVSVILN